MRHEDSLSRNPRMGLQLHNLHRIPDDERQAIRSKAAGLRDQLTAK